MTLSPIRITGARNGEGQFGQVIWFGPTEQNASAAFLLARDFCNRCLNTAFCDFGVRNHTCASLILRM
jgi:hypothetical protein